MTTTSPAQTGRRPAGHHRSLPPSALVPPRPGRARAAASRPAAGSRPASAPRAASDRPSRTAPLAWLPWALLAAVLVLLALVLLLGRLAGSEGGRSTGLLSAGDADLYTAAAVSDHVGEPVDGRDVLVESVVADEGFWVGSGPGSRVYVVLAPQARRAADESRIEVTAGSRLHLSGEVTRLDAAPDALGVSAAEGAQELRSQSAYVTATRVAGAD